MKIWVEAGEIREKGRVWSQAEVEALEGYLALLSELLEAVQEQRVGITVPEFGGYLVEYLSEELKNLEQEPKCCQVEYGQTGSFAYGSRNVR